MERKKAGDPQDPQRKETIDYWDNVADDAASGFRSNADENALLNADQLPDDHERADESGNSAE